MGGQRNKNRSLTLPQTSKYAIPPQDILNLFKIVFSDELYGGEVDMQEAIQSIKSDLYEREYMKAFDSHEKLVAYCCRWSPSRAIAYTSLFAKLRSVRKILQCKDPNDEDEDSEESDDEYDDDDDGSTAGAASEPESEDESEELSKQLEDLEIDPITNNVLCIGGGAGGELVAISSIFAPSRDYNSKYATVKSKVKPSQLNVQLVDIADWSYVVKRMEDGIKTNWLRSESPNLNVTFENKDILSMTHKELNLQNIDLITLLFTTNELFMEDKAKSIRFLQRLNQYCTSNTYLLIVESAGSFSHIEIGSKKFPIQFLIDAILLGKRGEEDDGNWELVDMEDAIWYRCAENLDYKMKVENMRVFYRLYRKK